MQLQARITERRAGTRRTDHRAARGPRPMFSS